MKRGSPIGKEDIFGVNCWAKLDIVGDFCCVCLQHPATVKEDQNSSSDASRSPTGSHSPEKPSKLQRDCFEGHMLEWF